MASLSDTSRTASGDRPAPGVPRVLVVDDDPQVRLLVRKALEHYGYVVTEAACGPGQSP